MPDSAGQHKGIWQYIVSDAEGIRLHYTVDEDARVVRTERLGRHLDWSRSRDRERLD